MVLKTTKPAFSSITIASKKISRTASLPGARAPRPQSYHSDEARDPGYKAPRPQSYHSDEARVPGYKAPRPQSYHSDEARVPGYKAPRPQSYHSDEASVPGYKAPRPQRYHSDEARVPGYKAPRPQSYHSDEAKVPGYKAPRPQSYHSDEDRVPGYKAPRPQSYHTNQARLSTTCTSVTQQDQVHHHHPTGNDPSSTPVTLRRKTTATIVKVTEHRRMNSEHVNQLNGRQSPVSSVSGDQPNDQGTVVHRRKATIIKVTEHRESYSPGQDASGGDSSNTPSEYTHSYTEGVYSPGQDASGGDSSSTPSEYTHSYTEGVYKHNSPWQQGAMNSPMNSMESLQSTPPSQYLLESSMDRIDRHNSALFVTPNKFTSTTTVALRDPEGSRGGGKPIQKSTLMLFINPPSPSSKETAIEKVGGERGGEERWARDRARRPVSCYANVFSHTDATEPWPVPETVTVTQAGPRPWIPETVTVTQAGPRHWSPETVTVTQAGPRHWSPETVTVTQAGPRHWSPETVTVTQAGPRHWSMGLPNQTQNSNIDPVRDWVKDTATSNSRLNTVSSSSSISAGPAGRDREMCPPETESSRPAGRDREMCLPETESFRPEGRGTGPAGRDREMCPPETESSRPEGRATEREGDLTRHPNQADARSNQPQPPAITLIQHQEPPSHQQSPEAVLALNAAAVIANIKLQRQLSLRKTTPHDLSTQDSRSSTSAEGGKTLVKDTGGCVLPRTDDNRLDPGETTRTTHPRTDDNRLDPGGSRAIQTTLHQSLSGQTERDGEAGGREEGGQALRPPARGDDADAP